MKYGAHIRKALEATRLLSNALSAGDLVKCAALLEDRERILAELADAHRTATHEERDRHRTDAAELLRADEILRERAEGELANAAGAMVRPPSPRTDRPEPLNACLDRKA